ncbi:MAG: PQQ-binding-like beta-propeller repeat protein [Pseudohongiellaceae bacterium]
MARSAFLLFIGLFSLNSVHAQDASVERGQAAFEAECSRCHIPVEMDGRLRARWIGRTGEELYEQIRQTMPAETPGSLSNQQYLDVTAFILHAGNVEIPGGSISQPELAALSINPGEAVADTDTGENFNWTHFHGNEKSTRYAPLSQINAGNVADLEIVWALDTGVFGPRPETFSVTTPLVVNGTMYATVGATRNVVAIDAVTGQLLWMWRPQEGERFDNAPRKGSGKGLSYYNDNGQEVIFVMTPGYFLVALNALTGEPMERFGAGGWIDLQEGLRLGPGREDVDIGMSFMPLVVGDVVVTGAAHVVGMRPVSASNVKGDVRGFDARSGELLWTFRTIPMRGEPGYETWLTGADYTGNAGVWAPMSADSELGMVYLPVESATGDRYGGDRHGSNLFSSSTVALDYKTGEMQWYFQTTHHDIWDWDTPAAPILADLPNGTPALIQTLKQSHVFTFHRETGESLFPIEERRVPQSDVPGEWSAPTQPYPLLPAPYDRQGFQKDDLADFTPGIAARAREIASRYRMSPSLYQPPSLYEDPDDGTLGTLHLPSSTGGSNWEGGAYDPETGILYISSRTAPSVLSLVHDPDASSVRYIHGGGRTPSISGIPLVKPPYGRITAINMVSGEHVWQVVNGDTPEDLVNHPLLEGVDLPRTGKPTRSGLVLTETLLFSGEGPGGDPVLWAHDKTSGEIIAKIDMPGAVTGVPMTFMVDGKQYLAMATSDFSSPAKIVTLALPD